jgi:hypothetical protein
MEKYISAEVMQNTDNCNKGFYCVSSPYIAYCRPILCMIDSVQIHKCLHESPCNYKVLVEKNHFKCTCPVRLELCKRHDSW